MKPAAVVGALFGGVFGAAVWAVLGWKLHFESGLVAWGIGLAVGAASYALGGRGMSNGLVCGFFALLSIFAGKVMAVRLGTPAEEVSRPMADFIAYVVQHLDLFDILFAGLGVVSAFQLGGRAEEEIPVYTPQQLSTDYPTPISTTIQEEPEPSKDVR
jgi:hypothetical protein